MKYAVALLFFIVHSIAHGEVTFGSNCPEDIKGKLADVLFRPARPYSVDYFDIVTLNIQVAENVVCAIQMTHENVSGGMAFFPVVGKSIEFKRADRTFKVSQ